MGATAPTTLARVAGRGAVRHRPQRPDDHWHRLDGVRGNLPVVLGHDHNAKRLDATMAHRPRTAASPGNIATAGCSCSNYFNAKSDHRRRVPPAWLRWPRTSDAHVRPGTARAHRNELCS